MDLCLSGTRTADTRSQSWMVIDHGAMQWPGALLMLASWHPAVMTVWSDCKSRIHCVYLGVASDTCQVVE